MKFFIASKNKHKIEELLESIPEEEREKIAKPLETQMLETEQDTVGAVRSMVVSVMVPP